MSEKIEMEFTVDPEYQGYTFVGWAKGRFKADNGEMKPYYNMYVISPVSSFESDDYKGFGFKAEKKSCISPQLLDGLQSGDQVRLFFDDKKRVSFVAKET